MTRFLPLLLLSVPALAGPEADRLMAELESLVDRGAWDGADRLYEDLLDAHEDEGDFAPARAHQLGAQAAAQRGDAIATQRRLLWAERTEPGITEGDWTRYRTEWGRLTVRRLDTTCLSLAPTERPFDPVKAAAVDAATAELADTGGFDGLLPIGDYVVGGQPLTVTPEGGVARLQREKGDSDC
jgi:hypothetical protein